MHQQYLKIASDSISGCYDSKNSWGGHAPKPPQKASALHTNSHLHLMTMQFCEWPIKLTFDWPLCQSNFFRYIVLCSLHAYFHSISHIYPKAASLLLTNAECMPLSLAKHVSGCCTTCLIYRCTATHLILYIESV